MAPGDDVEMRTLDSFQFADVDFIKVDCEGFEENVLVGACDTILRCHPTIIVEQKRDFAVQFGLKPRGQLNCLKAWGTKLCRS